MVVHWFDIGMVIGSNLGESELNFLFAKISFGMKGGLQNHWIMVIE